MPYGKVNKLGEKKDLSLSLNFVLNVDSDSADKDWSCQIETLPPHRAGIKDPSERRLTTS